MPNTSSYQNLILVANSSHACLYSSDNLRTSGLTLIKDFEHPDSRKKISDLMSDRPGHYKTDGNAHGSFDEGDPKKTEAEHFALELAKFIKGMLGSSKGTKLYVIALSHFCDLMKKHLHIHVKEIVTIYKDYTKYPTKDLLISLREHLGY
jgi:protein required for attachment to host cells